MCRLLLSLLIGGSFVRRVSCVSCIVRCWFRVARCVLFVVCCSLCMFVVRCCVVSCLLIVIVSCCLVLAIVILKCVAIVVRCLSIGDNDVFCSLHLVYWCMSLFIAYVFTCVVVVLSFGVGCVV